MRSSTDAVRRVTTYEYAGEQLTRVSDPLGRTLLKASHDAAGRVKEISDAVGTSYLEYDSAARGISRRTVVTDAAGMRVVYLALLARAKTDAMLRGLLGCLALTVLITALWVWGGRAVLGILPPGTSRSDAGWGVFETILGWPVMMTYVLVVTLLGYFINRHVQARVNSSGA